MWECPSNTLALLQRLGAILLSALHSEINDNRRESSAHDARDFPLNRFPGDYLPRCGAIWPWAQT
jgi:hypothetical protein